MPISGQKKTRPREQKDLDNLLPALGKKDLIKALRFQLDYLEQR